MPCSSPWLAHARSQPIRIWQDDHVYADERQPVAPGSDGALFSVELPVTSAKVHTWFYDETEQELAGAYYNYAGLAKPAETL